MTPRDTATPRHIIVRGGNNGEFYYEGKATNGRPDSAYFGEGMTSFTFWFDTPRVLVLPSTVQDIKLAADMAQDLKEGTEIYVAAPKGSKAWTLTEAAMKEAGYNTANLFEYTRPQVAVTGDGINEAGPGYALTTSVGAPTTVNVSAQGGTLGGRQIRVVQIGGDGTETVLQDWDSMQGSSDESASTASYTWTPTSADVVLRLDVRQDPHVVTSATVTVKAASDSAPAPGTWTWALAAGGTATRMAPTPRTRPRPSTARSTASTRTATCVPAGSSNGAPGTTTRCPARRPPAGSSTASPGTT